MLVLLKEIKKDDKSGVASSSMMFILSFMKTIEFLPEFLMFIMKHKKQTKTSLNK